jgi:hypothetical protein
MEDGIRSIPLPQAHTPANSELENPDQPCQSVAFPSPAKILFLSGYGTKPGEINPNILRTHGYTVVEPDLPDSDFARSVTIAQRVFNRHQPEVVVGWSRGGAVAMSIDSGHASLILIAPAWKNWGTMTTVKAEVTILHSPYDELVSIEDSRELLENSGLPPDQLRVVGEDHRMIDEEAFATLLEAVEYSGKHFPKRQAA